MPVPPRIVRRLVIAPVVVLAELAFLAASPLLVLLALLASPPGSGRRPLRLTFIALVLAAEHLRALIACLELWLAGRSADEEAHYAVLGAFAARVYDAAARLARVEVRVEGSGEAEAALSAVRRPAVVLYRHAGEGDSLLAVHQLLSGHGRRPRLVMHETLRLDPLIDVLGARLPNLFVDPRGGDTERDIAAMSTGLGPADAVVIFPEGGNVTPERRRRAIERLERAGHLDEAAVARAMRHVAAPRPGGALAAIAAAGDADVIFVGHDGFPTGLRELWRLLPHRQVVRVRLWLVPDRIPAGRDDQVAWLFERWRVLDDWIDE